VSEGISFADIIKDYNPDLTHQDIQECLWYAIEVVGVEDASSFVKFAGCGVIYLRITPSTIVGVHNQLGGCQNLTLSAI